jgi:hypothetical protein
MKLRTAVMLVGVLVGLSSPALGQVAELRPAPSVLFAADPVEPSAPDSLIRPKTHWKEGAMLLGGFGAGAGLIIGVAYCGYDGSSTDNCLGATVGTMLLLGLSGATIGGLIGGLFPKS